MQIINNHVNRFGNAWIFKNSIIRKYRKLNKNKNSWKKNNYNKKDTIIQSSEEKEVNMINNDILDILK